MIDTPRFVYTWSLVPSLQANCKLFSSFNSGVSCVVNFVFYIRSKYTFHGHHGILIDSFAKNVNIKLVKEPYFEFLYELQHFTMVCPILWFKSESFSNDTSNCSASSNYKSLVKFTPCVLGWRFLIMWWKENFLFHKNPCQPRWIP